LGVTPTGTLRNLGDLARYASAPQSLDQTFQHALVALGELVAYDLAALYEIEGSSLFLRASAGRLSARVKGHRLSLERFSSIRRALTVRRPLVLEQHHHEGEEGDPYDGVLDLPPGHSCMVVPLYEADRPLGIITLDAVACGSFTDETLALCHLYAQIVSMAISFAHRSAELEVARSLLEEQNRVLVEDVGSYELACRHLDASESPAMKAIVRLAKQVAITDSYVVVQGETGTGKEVVAQAIHAWSPRRKGPMVKLNCGAIPENLVESELFGHVRGAFTGAVKARPGRFLAAQGGTLFLDEIGDMPLAAQTKLLRALQEKSIEPVGADESIAVDVRVIVASHVDLEAAVANGDFREDLYYRLAVFPIALPALRERVEDIVPLALGHLLELSLRGRRGPWILTDEAKDALRREPWPGNVRQLVNAVERATIVKPRGAIDAVDLALRGVGAGRRHGMTKIAPGALATVKDEERNLIARALERSGGKIYGKDGAAALLGVRPTTLQSKVKRLGLA
jgi:transcriptional regulator with GAF, ATPase, and Fis domain